MSQNSKRSKRVVKGKTKMNFNTKFNCTSQLFELVNPLTSIQCIHCEVDVRPSQDHCILCVQLVQINLA